MPTSPLEDSKSTASLFENLFSFDTEKGMMAFVICLVAVILGAVLLLALFLPRRNEEKVRGFGGFLYRFWNFKTLLSEGLLRFLYLVIAGYVTVYPIVFLCITDLGDAFWETLGGALLWIIVSNLVLRLAFELLMLLIVICRNSSEINQKLNKRNAEGNPPPMPPYGGQVPPQPYWQPPTQEWQPTPLPQNQPSWQPTPPPQNQPSWQPTPPPQPMTPPVAPVPPVQETAPAAETVVERLMQEPQTVTEEAPIEAPVEAPVEDAPVEEVPEAVAETSTEVLPTEEPAAEEPTPVTETVVEEPVAEETVAEEPAAEESVAEEPVAEEPVAEDPAPAAEPLAAFCTQCGSPLNPEAKFCSRCGTPR